MNEELTTFQNMLLNIFMILGILMLAAFVFLFLALIYDEYISEWIDDIKARWGK